MMAYIWRLVSFARRNKLCELLKEIYLTITQIRFKTTTSKLLVVVREEYALQLSPQAVPYDLYQELSIHHFHGHDESEAHALIPNYLKAQTILLLLKVCYLAAPANFIELLVFSLNISQA